MEGKRMNPARYVSGRPLSLFPWILHFPGRAGVVVMNAPVCLYR